MAVTFVGASEVSSPGGGMVSGLSTYVATQPGDIVVAFTWFTFWETPAGRRADGSSMTTAGADWQMVDVGRSWRSTGSPTRSQSLLVVHAATATGTQTHASFSWPGTGAGFIRLMVWRGAKAWKLGGPTRLVSQQPTWPEVATAYPSDGLSLLLGLGMSAAPTGATLRGAFFYQLYVYERAFTAVSPIPGASSAGYETGWTYNLALLENVAPQPPSLIDLPTGSTRDLAAGLTVRWSPDGAQSHYQLKRTTGGTSYWWTGSAWSTSEATVAGSATEVTLPSLANGGAAHTFEVRTKDDPSRPDWSGWATATVTGLAAPTVSQVRVFKWGSPDVTAGGTLNTRTPYVDVNGDAAAGATLTGWRAVIRQGSTVLFDTGITPAWWRQLTVEEALPNNITNVYVDGWVYQNGTQPSAKVTVGPFSVSVPSPGAPTILTEQIEHPDSFAPGVRLTIDTGWANGGTVELTRGDGSQMSLDLPTGQTTVTVDDYNAPSNGDVDYVVQVLDENVPQGSSPATPVTVPGPVVREEWLIDPLDPSTARQITLTALDDQTFATRVTHMAPFTGSVHVVRQGVVAAPVGSMTITTLDGADTDAVHALLTSGRALLLRLRPEVDGTDSTWRTDDLRFRVISDLARKRVVPGRNVAWREHTFEWAQVQQ